MKGKEIKNVRPVEKKKGKNSLLIIIAVIFILIILIIFGCSYVKETEENGEQEQVTGENKEKIQADISEEEIGKEAIEIKSEGFGEKTKDWNSYENDLYKYKLKYPESWFSSPDNKGDSWVVYFTNYKTEKPEDIANVEGVKVEILVQGNPRELSLSEWVNEGHLFSGEPKNSQNIIISDKVAIKEEVDFEGMTTTTYLFNGNDVITISYTGADSEYNINKGNFDLMLESFQLEE
jgi:hypothetical protein